eukprot:Cvel_5513.t2-p1 / transcript=Cvel_5513.t2 / gene=Cvel_5513 / organism=Chromera_velia_CCMP2878 / gene_product=Acyltransferase MdmB, putative / transcript_product=Acyltransferase MdmB, putative / location=Cvel_scaffold258:53052-55118(+) / protein_length=403 / sequence_SO=supercontig / SO=protein_coding / is_pseudo=false
MRDPSSLTELGAFLFQRLAPMYPVYLLSLIIPTAFCAAQRRVDEGFLKAVGVHAFLLQAWVPDPLIVNTFLEGGCVLNSPSWFLSTLVPYYFVFPLLVCHLRRVSRGALAAVICGCAFVGAGFCLAGVLLGAQGREAVSPFVKFHPASYFHLFTMGVVLSLICTPPRAQGRDNSARGLRALYGTFASSSASTCAEEGGTPSLLSSGASQGEDTADPQERQTAREESGSGFCFRDVAALCGYALFLGLTAVPNRHLFFYGNDGMFFWFFPMVVAGPFLLIIWGLSGEGSHDPLVALFSLPPLRFLGEISMEIYLLHTTVRELLLPFVGDVWGHKAEAGIGMGLMRFSGHLCLLIAVAAVCHYALTRPVGALLHRMLEKREERQGEQADVPCAMKGKERRNECVT